MYDVVIVGAGLSGSIIARELAETNKRILILERRSHIAGNLFDKKNEYNILIQEYGPHIFHTNNETVYDYIKNYSSWIPFKLKCEVFMNGENTPSPFNFKTIDTFYGKEDASNIKEALLSNYSSETVSIVELLDSPVILIREYAEMLFKYDYSLYTAKQWGINPSEIDKSVLKRVPVRLDYKEMYFNDKYECLPHSGYTKFIEKLLDHKNINVETSKDALHFLNQDDFHKKISIDQYLVSKNVQIVYTGAIDELFNYQFGELPYRSLDFIYKTLSIDSFQNAPVVAYPQEPDFTRITEYKKLPVQNIPNLTTLAYEYPLKYNKDSNNERYYPIPTSESDLLYLKYKKQAMTYSNLYLCGRLAEFKYYNMDQIVEKSLALSSFLKKQINYE